MQTYLRRLSVGFVQALALLAVASSAGLAQPRDEAAAQTLPALFGWFQMGANGYLHFDGTSVAFVDAAGDKPEVVYVGDLHGCGHRNNLLAGYIRPLYAARVFTSGVTEAGYPLIVSHQWTGAWRRNREEPQLRRVVVSCNTPDRTPQGSQIRHIVELQLTDADIERQREDRGIPPVEEVALYGYFPLYMVPSGLLQEFRSRGMLTDTAIGTQFRGYRAVRLEPPAEVAQLLEILMEKRARDYIAMRNAGLL